MKDNLDKKAIFKIITKTFSSMSRELKDFKVESIYIYAFTDNKNKVFKKMNYTAKDMENAIDLFLKSYNKFNYTSFGISYSSKIISGDRDILSFKK